MRMLKRLLIGMVMLSTISAICANGDYTRTQHVMMKLKNGESIKIAALGGSITTGYQAEPVTQNCWAALVANWWREKAQEYGADIKYMNEGVSGTDSAFASVRIDDHILKNNPDIVFLEFAMNDQWLLKSVRERTYEGIIRKMLKDSDRAIISLYVNEKGEPCKSQQDEQQPICEHYGIPSVSWRDNVRILVEKNEADWNDFFNGSENVHPNNEGHKSIAEFIIMELERIWESLPNNKEELSLINRELPLPLTKADFENAILYHSGNLEPETNNGWNKGSDVHSEWVSHGNAKQGWNTNKNESEMTFRVKGKSIGIIYSESDKYRNGEAWVTYIDSNNNDKKSRKVTLETYSSYRNGYLGWAYRLIQDSDVEQEYILHVAVKKSRKTDDGKFTNITGIIITK